MSDDDTCSHGRPNHQELIRELREAVGLFAGAMPVTPKEAWEEAVAKVAELEAIVRDLAATEDITNHPAESVPVCVLCRAWSPDDAEPHKPECAFRRARELTGDDQ